MKSDKVPVPSQVQERVLPEARCDDTAVPRVPDSAHTAPPARCPAQSAGTLHSMPWSQPSAAPRTLASGAASSAPGCGRRGDRRDRSGVCSSRRHLEATADLAAHCWASISSRGLVKTCTGTELGRGRGPAPAVPRSPPVALLRFPCTLPSPPPPPDTQSPGLAPCTPTRGSVTPCSVAAGPAALSQQGARRRLPRTGPRTTWGPLCRRESD